MEPADGKHLGNLPRRRTVLEREANDRCGKEQQRPGKNDRHDARVIDFQGHILRLTAVHFATDHALCVLHRDLAHALRDRDYCRDDDKQKRNHEHKDGWIDLAGPGLR